MALSNTNPPRSRKPPPPPTRRPGASGPRIVTLRYVIGGVLAGTVLALVGSIVFLLVSEPDPKQASEQVADAMSGKNRPAAEDAAANSVGDSASVPGSKQPSNADLQAAVSDSAEPVVQEPNPPPETQRPEAKARQKSGSQTGQQAAADNPFQDLQKLGNRLQIPPLPMAASTGAVAEGPVQLVRLAAKTPTECRLALFDIDTGSENAALKLGEPEDLAAENARRWAVIRSPLPDAGGDDVTIGYFQLRGESFSFAWGLDPPEAARPHDLRLCLLEISIAGQRAKCTLSRTIRLEPIRLNLEKERVEVQVPPVLANLDRAQFEVWLDGEQQTERNPLAPDSPVEFKVNCLVGGDTVPVSVKVSLQRQSYPEPAFRLTAEYFLSRKQVRVTKGVGAVKTVRVPATLADARKEKEQIALQLNRLVKDLDVKVKRQSKMASPEGESDPQTERAAARKAKSDNLEKEIETLQESIETLKSGVEWIDQLLDSLEVLQTRCRIGLEAFVINQAMRIELLSTKTSAPAKIEE